MGFWSSMLGGKKTEADVARSVDTVPSTYLYGDLAGCRDIRLQVTLPSGVNDLELFALLRLSQSFAADEKKALVKRLIREPRYVVLACMETLRHELREMQRLARDNPHVMYVQEQRVLAEWAVVETTFHF